MIDFTKPLLADEVPEPPIIEQTMKEDAQKRARQSLAGIQGAAKAAEEAGLLQKPAPPVKQIQNVKALGPKAAPSKKPVVMPPKTKAETLEKKPKPKRTQEPVKAKPPEAPPAVDHDKELRQSVLQRVLADLPDHPDADAVSGLFDLYTRAPEKEAAGAALVLATSFLRAPAKARGPLMKAFGPAMRKYRGSELAEYLLVRLGKVIAAKPAAPPAPPPPPGG